jgi:hypothetical protein
MEERETRQQQKRSAGCDNFAPATCWAVFTHPGGHGAGTSQGAGPTGMEKANLFSSGRDSHGYPPSRTTAPLSEEPRPPKVCAHSFCLCP